MDVDEHLHVLGLALAALAAKDAREALHVEGTKGGNGGFANRGLRDLARIAVQPAVDQVHLGRLEVGVVGAVRGARRRPCSGPRRRPTRRVLDVDVLLLRSEAGVTNVQDPPEGLILDKPTRPLRADVLHLELVGVWAPIGELLWLVAHILLQDAHHLGEDLFALGPLLLLRLLLSAHPRPPPSTPLTLLSGIVVVVIAPCARLVDVLGDKRLGTGRHGLRRARSDHLGQPRRVVGLGLDLLHELLLSAIVGYRHPTLLTNVQAYVRGDGLEITSFLLNEGARQGLVIFLLVLILHDLRRRSQVRHHVRGSHPTWCAQDRLHRLLGDLELLVLDIVVTTIEHIIEVEVHHAHIIVSLQHALHTG